MTITRTYALWMRGSVAGVLGLVLTAAPARGDPATPASFAWSVQGNTAAEAGVTCFQPECHPPGGSCNSSPGPTFSQSGSTLEFLAGTSSAHTGCGAWCVCCLPSGTGGEGTANAAVQISAESSETSTQWSVGADLAARATVGGQAPGDSCSSGTATASGSALQQWQLDFDTEQVGLTFNRTHLLTINGPGVSATSEITLAGPSGPVFTESLALSTVGSTGGSGSMQALLSPGRYSLTIESQLDAGASFPPGVTGGGQVKAIAYLSFTPCSTAIELAVGKGVLLDAVLSWISTTVATSYDVVRGELAILLESEGDFTIATTECLADDLEDTSFSYPALPEPGEGFWFLVRANQCGGVGSYDSGGFFQQGSRDLEIDSSPGACP